VIETTGDLVTFVLRASGINGVGQSPLAEDSNTCLDWLRALIAQWQRKRWLNWSLIETSFVSTGANSYTIGPGGDFDTPRPDKLHADRPAEPARGIHRGARVVALRQNADVIRIAVAAGSSRRDETGGQHH
jgi:hypothetical protein